MGHKVAATELGYFGRLREVDEEFFIENEQQFSEVWMRYVDGPPKKKVPARKKADSAKKDGSGEATTSHDLEEMGMAGLRAKARDLDVTIPVPCSKVEARKLISAAI